MDVHRGGVRPLPHGPANDGRFGGRAWTAAFGTPLHQIALLLALEA